MPLINPTSWYMPNPALYTGGGGGGGGSLTFTVPGGGTNSASITGTPTLPTVFSNLNIGTASGDRIVVVTLQWKGAASSPNADITTGHVTANSGAITFTQACHYFNSTTKVGHSVWFALVTSGTTMNLSVTSTGGTGWVNDINVEVAVLTGSATASVSSIVNTPDGGPPGYPNSFTNSNSASVTVPTGGVAIISSFVDITSLTANTWTGTTSSSPDITETSADVSGCMCHAISSATVAQSVSNTGGSGWASASFQP